MKFQRRFKPLNESLWDFGMEILRASWPDALRMTRFILAARIHS
jgi:hypothetical protein